jgi:hypothetical protein
MQLISSHIYNSWSIANISMCKYRIKLSWFINSLRHREWSPSWSWSRAVATPGVDGGRRRRPHVAAAAQWRRRAKARARRRRAAGSCGGGGVRRRRWATGRAWDGGGRQEEEGIDDLAKNEGGKKKMEWAVSKSPYVRQLPPHRRT